AFTIHADGTNLRRQQYLGGHPEWDDGHVMLGELDGRLVRYHVDRQVIVGSEGPAGTFVDPGGDTALSPDRKWVANGHKDSPAGLSYFTLLSRHEKRTLRSSGIPIGEWTTGDLRIDPAPSWNRSSNQILFGALDGESQTRQLFVLTLQ
ncbi:MAG: hypothetical protein KDA45_04820, partial [Planctomycetales bacterium]|nr:hypothetical protein [Planctomycetales bacterium]